MFIFRIFYSSYIGISRWVVEGWSHYDHLLMQELLLWLGLGRARSNTFTHVVEERQDFCASVDFLRSKANKGIIVVRVQERTHDAIAHDPDPLHLCLHLSCTTEWKVWTRRRAEDREDNGGLQSCYNLEIKWLQEINQKSRYSRTRPRAQYRPLSPPRWRSIAWSYGNMFAGTVTADCKSCWIVI